VPPPPNKPDVIACAFAPTSARWADRGVPDRRAAKGFQKAAGITVDGIVGPQTWRLLG
jgi:peptidoglycan hydrolase-like protein with peptidoglycan-binding domain